MQYRHQLAVAALASLCFLTPAHADTITTFDVSATLLSSGIPGFTCGSPCALAGTLTIDVTLGLVTASTITAPGTTIPGPYDQSISSFSGIPGVTIISLFDSLNDRLFINLSVSSLVNYAGGPICVGLTGCSGTPTGIQNTSFQQAYLANSGNLSPVPGPVAGAGLPGLIAACGGLLAWRRRRRNIAAAA
jgi:hypothetical protein